MYTLGITDGQTSGAAVVQDGRILAAINEERIARIKLARGFPRESIREALRLSGVRPQEIAEVAVAQANMELTEEILDWPGWFEARQSDRNLHSRFFQIASRFGSLVPRVPGLKQAEDNQRCQKGQHGRVMKRHGRGPLAVDGDRTGDLIERAASLAKGSWLSRWMLVA